VAWAVRVLSLCNFVLLTHLSSRYNVGGEIGISYVADVGEVERIYISSIYRCYFVLGNPNRILGHGSAEGGLPSYPQFCSLEFGQYIIQPTQF